MKALNNTEKIAMYTHILQELLVPGTAPMYNWARPHMCLMIETYCNKYHNDFYNNRDMYNEYIKAEDFPEFFRHWPDDITIGESWWPKYVISNRVYVLRSIIRDLSVYSYECLTDRLKIYEDMLAYIEDSNNDITGLCGVLDIVTDRSKNIEAYPELIELEALPEYRYSEGSLYWFPLGIKEPRIELLKKAIAKTKSLLNDF